MRSYIKNEAFCTNILYCAMGKINSSLCRYKTYWYASPEGGNSQQMWGESKPAVPCFLQCRPEHPTQANRLSLGMHASSQAQLSHLWSFWHIPRAPKKSASYSTNKTWGHRNIGKSSNEWLEKWLCGENCARLLCRPGILPPRHVVYPLLTSAGYSRVWHAHIQKHVHM